MKTPVNVVFSSGPVGGKTEIIKYLYRVLIGHGFQPFIVPEIATDLEKTGIHPKHLGGLANNAFQHVVAAKYMQSWYKVYEEIQTLQEKNFMQGTPVILHDRGFFDQRVYCENQAEFEHLKSFYLPKEWEEKYGLVVHMQSLAVDKPDLYEKLFHENSARHAHETVEFARNMDGDFVKAWSNVPHCKVVTISNNGNFDDKLSHGMEIVLDHLKQVA